MVKQTNKQTRLERQTMCKKEDGREPGASMLGPLGMRMALPHEPVDSVAQVTINVWI